MSAVLASFFLIFNPVILPPPIQGKLAEADPLNLRAIEIGEKVFGPEHSDLAVWLNNRARLLKAQVRALRIFRDKACGANDLEDFLGGDLPRTSTNALLVLQGKLSEAEPLYKRLQEIFEKSLGQDHPNVATILFNRAGSLQDQVRAVRIEQEKSCGA